MNTPTPPGRPVAIVGRFPPPLDGQTLATRRLGELLARDREVHTVDVGAPDPGVYTPTEATFQWYRVTHFVAARRTLTRALAPIPDAPVLWASVSPVPLGHYRDLLTTLPTFGRRPVFAISHRAYFDRMFSSPLTRWTASRVLQRVEAFVFLTSTLADRCAPWIPAEKRFVIPNAIGADVECTAAEVEAKRARYSPTRPARILFLGNMMPEKGYREALEAVRLLRSGGQAVEADFVGRWLNDEDREAFGAAVQRGGLQPYVRHHGGVTDRGHLRTLLLDADLLLFPSTHPSEAQPLAVIEAMNAGTPVVSTRNGGIPEALGSGGVLTDDASPRALADAALDVLRPAAWHAASAAGRSRFEHVFSADAVRARWLSLLDTHRTT